MLLSEIATTSETVAATPARLAKIESLAGCLARLQPAEIGIAVGFLSGELRQRQIGVGYAALRDRPPPAATPSLALTEVDAAFERIGRQAGPGSQAERRRLLAALLGRATAAVPATQVRRALMLRGALGAVAETALRDGVDGLRAFRLQVGRPLQPMLAQTAGNIDSALERVSPAAVEWKLDGTSASLGPPGEATAAARPRGAGIEWKLDGVRVQIHRQDREVRVFTRTLDEITDRVPEVVEAVTALPAGSLVLDGEVIALREDGRPQPFQVTAGRVGSKLDVATVRRAVPLSLFAFDLLHLDGEDLLDRPGSERQAALAKVVPEALRVPRVVTADPAIAAAFLQDALARGHEGVVVKSLDAPYEAGRRGAGWLKVKPVHTLDLVVLAAEWGHGRRRGWLSNLHLGARDPETGGWVMLGKTFKGLTDKMLTWQTERLQQLAVGPGDWVVHVRPELVVEVAFDGVQSSPRYPGGLALRFARVLRYREDKRAEEADTIATVRAIHAGAPPR